MAMPRRQGGVMYCTSSTRRLAVSTVATVFINSIILADTRRLASSTVATVFINSTILAERNVGGARHPKGAPRFFLPITSAPPAA